MNDEVFKANSERVGREGMSRRLFLRATLAGGASLLAGRAATLFAAASATEKSSFNIGGDLPVNRLGFGAMGRSPPLRVYYQRLRSPISDSLSLRLQRKTP